VCRDIVWNLHKRVVLSVSMDVLIHVEVFIGGPLLLEVRLVEGLLEFGRAHPQWRFSLRGADFRYSAGWLKRYRISGALVMIETAPIRRALNASGVPWVHLLPGGKYSHPVFVDVDDTAIGRLGAEKFLELGFKQFAFLGSHSPWSAARAAGFAGRLAEAGYTCDRLDAEFISPVNWTPEPRSAREVAHWARCLKKRTAIMAFNDFAAVHLLDVCAQIGLHVPNDVAVLGVGNHELICEMCPVPISSIDTNVSEVARRGARLLESLIKKRRVDMLGAFVQPRALVERRSTEVMAFEDAMVARLVNYVRDHVCDGLTVEQLAAAFQMSHRTLTRRCLRSLGRTPVAEIKMARLRHARRMLAGTRLTLTEIAMACGFADLSHMDKAFRTAFDSTPGAMRQR